MTDYREIKIRMLKILHGSKTPGTEKRLLEYIAQELQNEGIGGVCEWQTDEYAYGYYETSCGHTWEFIEDGIKENNVKVCMYCGKPVKEIINDHPADD